MWRRTLLFVCLSTGDSDHPRPERRRTARRSILSGLSQSWRAVITGGGAFATCSSSNEPSRGRMCVCSGFKGSDAPAWEGSDCLRNTTNETTHGLHLDSTVRKKKKVAEPLSPIQKGFLCVHQPIRFVFSSTSAFPPTVDSAAEAADRLSSMYGSHLRDSPRTMVGCTFPAPTWNPPSLREMKGFTSIGSFQLGAFRSH
ncbi:hypothetical protein B0T16DRAFT_119360 [Cercophora newfieldiana]|uniref:Uncharacterized protein n=1 Tax=Cercophora newfieldiana TaxID=92897 RepID=A0AA39YAJ3_9PEZI|nr:hypothetical protein B0T16DRAFT_119360 [Cercophora newfieldiana]